MTKKIKFYKDFIAEQIKGRYLIEERDKKGSSNTVVDTFVPGYFYGNYVGKGMGDRISKVSYCISEYFADTLGRPAIPTEELCEILGYKKKDINSLLYKASQQKIDMVLVGYGGTGVNTLHWLTKMCEMTGKQNIFESLFIFEREDAEFSNILRFPKNCNKIFPGNDSASKLNIFYEEELLTRKSSKLIPEYLTDDAAKQLFIDLDKPLFYGAPSIETREWLNKYNFIAGLHGGDSCNLIVKPEQDSKLQEETYGKIRLNSFFLNQLRMAIGLLEAISNFNDIDWSKQNQMLLDYEVMRDAKENLEASKYDFQFKYDEPVQPTLFDESGEPLVVEDEVAELTDEPEEPVEVLIDETPPF